MASKMTTATELQAQWADWWKREEPKIRALNEALQKGYFGPTPKKLAEIIEREYKDLKPK